MEKVRIGKYGTVLPTESHWRVLNGLTGKAIKEEDDYSLVVFDTPLYAAGCTIEKLWIPNSSLWKPDPFLVENL